MTHEQQMELWRETAQRERMAYEAGERRKDEHFRSIITAGQAAVRSAILINGGAAAALLAFVGNAIAHGRDATNVAHGIVCFGVGMFLAASAAGFTYLTQCDYFDGGNEKRGDMLRRASIAAGICSLVVFLVGIFVAYFAFIGMMAVTPE